MTYLRKWLDSQGKKKKRTLKGMRSRDEIKGIEKNAIKMANGKRQMTFKVL